VKTFVCTVIQQNQQMIFLLTLDFWRRVSRLSGRL